MVVSVEALRGGAPLSRLRDDALVGLPLHWQKATEFKVLHVSWSDVPERFPNPQLCIYAVPSHERVAAGDWIRSVVADEVESWRAATEGSLPWREANKMKVLAMVTHDD